MAALCVTRLLMPSCVTRLHAGLQLCDLRVPRRQRLLRAGQLLLQPLHFRAALSRLHAYQ